MNTQNDVFEKPNTDALLTYIDSSFDVYEFNRELLYEEDHSLSDWVLNRKSKPGREVFIFGFKVDDAYAYKSDTSNSFAIYLLFKLNRNIAKELADKWGDAINAFREEISNLDFDMLVWRVRDGVRVDLMTDFSKNYKLSERGNCIITISNMNGLERNVIRL